MHSEVLVLLFSTALFYGAQGETCPNTDDIWYLVDGTCYLLTEELRPVFAQRDCENTRELSFLNPRGDNGELIAMLASNVVWTNARIAGINDDRFKYDRGDGEVVRDRNGDMVRPEGNGNCLAYDPVAYEFIPVSCQGSNDAEYSGICYRSAVPSCDTEGQCYSLTDLARPFFANKQCQDRGFSLFNIDPTNMAQVEAMRDLLVDYDTNLIWTNAKIRGQGEVCYKYEFGTGGFVKKIYNPIARFCASKVTNRNRCLAFDVDRVKYVPKRCHDSRIFAVCITDDVGTTVSTTTSTSTTSTTTSSTTTSTSTTSTTTTSTTTTSTTTTSTTTTSTTTTSTTTTTTTNPCTGSADTHIASTGDCVYSSESEDLTKRPRFAEFYCEGLGLDLYNPQPNDPLIAELFASTMEEIYIWTDARLSPRGLCFRFANRSFVVDANGDKVCVADRKEQCLAYDVQNQVYKPFGCHNLRQHFVCI